jgi:hypothetical protein
MRHRVLYQDDYVMLSAGLFGGLRIQLLDRKILRKLSAQERAVVSATVEAARKNGAPTTPENNALAGVFCSVCKAFVVGSVTWKATFLDDPEVVGALIAKDYLESRK